MSLVKLRFLFANYDRVEVTKEYDLESTKIETIRSDLHSKVPELKFFLDDSVDKLLDVDIGVSPCKLSISKALLKLLFALLIAFLILFAF